MGRQHRSWRRRRGGVAAVLVAALVTALAARQDNIRDGLVIRGPSLVNVPLDGAVPGGPSILLSYANGASPYSGIGRYEGHATCTAFFLATALPTDDVLHTAPAYAVTSGHCVAKLGANDVLIDAPGAGRVVFNYFVDGDRWRVELPVTRIAYATTKGSDLALVELGTTYRSLVQQLIRPLRVARLPEARPGEQLAIVGAPLWRDMNKAFLRVTTCAIDGIAPIVVEHTWHWFDMPFNRCRDIEPGSAGSPAISVLGKMVVGMVSATTSGAPDLTTCAIDHPCEPSEDGARSRAATTYITPLANIYPCFDGRHRVDVRQPGCPLDPGTQVSVTPSFVGDVNPRLESTPVGAPQRMWHVSVSGDRRLYRFAVVQPPHDDCRTTTAYSTVLDATTTPVIEAPFPSAERFSFLCIVGVNGRDEGEETDVQAHPTIVVARVDMTPPRGAAPITVLERDADWKVAFKTIGTDVAFYVTKYGPPSDTRCREAAGYQRLELPFIGLPKLEGPYRLCVIPYDAAQNPGRLFERTLP